MWLALLTAPYVSGGIVEIIQNLSVAINNPFSITVCGDSVRTVLIFLIAYGMGIGVYFSTRRNYRKGEEHGSAKWGNAGTLNKKYRDKNASENKLLTQSVRIGLDGKKHRRNLNILVVGGSGAGKTRFFCKPNVMQCNTSMVILDPKGEIVRDTGGLLEKKGYEVRVLDLINMHKSHCYNPFVYLRNDNDVQRLVTNLFKATTPKGSQSQDPFWDTAASMLLLSLVFYLKYEAPPDEQNFPMVMELLRAGEVREDDDSYVSPILSKSSGKLTFANSSIMNWQWTGRLPPYLWSASYLKYEAPPEEQNFPMVMELLRAGEVREPRPSSIPMRLRSQWYGVISGNWYSICSSLSVRLRWQTVW